MKRSLAQICSLYIVTQKFMGRRYMKRLLKLHVRLVTITITEARRYLVTTNFCSYLQIEKIWATFLSLMVKDPKLFTLAGTLLTFSRPISPKLRKLKACQSKSISKSRKISNKNLRQNLEKQTMNQMQESQQNRYSIR